MAYHHLDKNIVTAWRVARFLRLAVVIVILGIPTLIVARQDFFVRPAPYVYAVEAFIFLYLMVTLFIYPVIEYRQWGYLILDDRIEIKHGIFFIATSIIPVIRIQHISIEHGPILRKLGLASVRIHTASGAFVIEGLAADTARTITEALKNQLYTRLQAQENM
ncbi:PH domain-containing protein [Dehalobacter sp. DCM]|uniref:PH domain-containing protein n=1 Tax=Dehalobacter sp. DCM TaxID=2907827 RepID=UPI00308174C6|nr:PH domain-containing protein [Dehalobacter sp. DCM]